MFWEGELIPYLCSVFSRQNRILLKPASEMEKEKKKVYVFVPAACPANKLFSFFFPDSFIFFFFSFREMMDGPVLLDLTSDEGNAMKEPSVEGAWLQLH